MQPTRVCIVEDCTSPQHGRGACRSHYMEYWRGNRVLPKYDPHKKSKAARFWEKVKVSGPDDCWIWQASKYPNGYGQFGRTGAHRVSVELSGRTIPEGWHVDHLCRRVDCVNPTHLEAVTPSENTLRGYAGALAASRVIEESAKRTTCVHGHKLTPENTYTPPSNKRWRVCRKCRYLRYQKYKLQRKMLTSVASGQIGERGTASLVGKHSE